jgi:biotin transport system substrate-specific component
VSIAQPRNVTIIDNVISRSRVSDVALVLAGVALTALSAQVSIPAFPVPFTFQTLAVLVIGSTFGAARGAITMGLYALVGALGLPVFEGASSGLSVLFGYSGGFIIGFIFAASLAGRLAELQWSSNVLKALAGFVISTVVIYGFGIPVLAMHAYGSDLLAATQDMLPYLGWDFAKSVIAAGLIPSAWLLVKKIKG